MKRFRQFRPRMAAKASLLAIISLGLLACPSRDAPPPPLPVPRENVPAPPVAEPEPPAPPPRVKPPLDPRIEAWQKAGVPYLEPGDFPEAPPELRKALSALGCRIPQVSDYEFPDSPPAPFVPGNLVSGYFKSTSELHWAVLCSQQGRTTLMVFDSLGNLEDQLEGPGDDPAYGFDSYIGVADREHILDDYQSFGGSDTPAPPPIFHEGLESGVSEKASLIYYWHECQWIELQGGD